MQRKLLLVVAILASLLIATLFLSANFLTKPSQNDPPSVFVGVDIAYNDLAAAKNTVDRVSPYVNLIIMGNTGINWDVDQANELAKYIYDKDLYFVYFTGPSDGMPNQGEWVDSAVEKWGSRFLGFYMYDEWGGRQIDQGGDPVVQQAANYSDAASQYVYWINQMYTLDQNVTHSGNRTKMTSDYSLYWFDYKIGYDVILAEFAWNYSRQLTIALNRGAATAFNRDWGIMITWEYTQAPYLESGEELYNDMVLAYENGAKYIVVFDADEGHKGDILQQEHIDAFKRFQEYMANNPQPIVPANERIAYVLPKDYGYGFRNANDRIWGLWPADELSYGIYTDVKNLLHTYGSKLDIVYDEKIAQGSTAGYSGLVFWNGTTLGNLSS